MAIYCMSGTGNSYFVGKKLADCFGLKLINIVRLEGTSQEPIQDDDELVGFVFPIYDFDAPKIIYHQLNKFKLSSKAYVFSIGTYGVGTLSAYKKISAKFRDKGIPLSAGFGLEMPHNAVGSVNLSTIDIQKKLSVSEARLPKIIQSIEHRALGDNMTTKALSLIADGTFFKMLPSVLPLLKALIIDGSESLRFVADESCSHCGICESLCPKDNIHLVQGKPAFGEDCLSCFGCIQWCTESAISFGGKRLGLGHYTHPQVEVAELIAFNQPTREMGRTDSNSN